jgi:hypothetical protein
VRVLFSTIFKSRIPSVRPALGPVVDDLKASRT